jgi:phenylalanyl-tRNA synthetase alpha chain
VVDALTGQCLQQPRAHPHTLHGRQVNAYQDGRWVEVWECGLAHPRLLAAARLHGRSGLALGIGLDRLLMLVKHIADIRLLRSGDPRIARQMLGLARYQHVSLLPPISRELSLAVGEDDDEETLGDQVRDALGADANCVEEVRALSATAYRQLPASAISRLGAKPGQKNLLVRVVLRDLQRTLTNETANASVTGSTGRFIRGRNTNEPITTH